MRVVMDFDFPFDAGSLVCVDTELAEKGVAAPVYRVEGFRLFRKPDSEGKLTTFAENELAGIEFGHVKRIFVSAGALRPAPKKEPN